MECQQQSLKVIFNYSSNPKFTRAGGRIDDLPTSGFALGEETAGARPPRELPGHELDAKLAIGETGEDVKLSAWPASRSVAIYRTVPARAMMMF
jgi:hypothetical protein